MLRNKKAQTTMLMIAGIVIFLIITMFTNITNTIGETSLQSTLQQQENKMQEEKTLTWQYREAIRASIVEGLNISETIPQQPREVFLQNHVTTELPKYLWFTEQQEQPPEVTILWQEKRIIADVSFLVKKEKVGYTLQKQSAQVIVPYE